jgi:hypothetical protein
MGSRATITYQPALDGVRAIAVLAVLAFHAEVPGFSGGYLGVSVFFTLSGFLVSTLNSSLISNTGSSENNQLISSTPNRTNIENSVQTLSPGEPIGGIISSGNSSSIMISSQGSREDTTGIGQLNQTDNLSNNLVSMLSGIIIQSIEKGNPTISNDGNTSDSGSLINKNISTIVSGNWKMNVNSSKV